MNSDMNSAFTPSKFWLLQRRWKLSSTAYKNHFKIQLGLCVFCLLALFGLIYSPFFLMVISAVVLGIVVISTVINGLIYWANNQIVPHAFRSSPSSTGLIKRSEQLFEIEAALFTQKETQALKSKGVYIGRLENGGVLGINRIEPLKRKFHFKGVVNGSVIKVKLFFGFTESQKSAKEKFDNDLCKAGFDVNKQKTIISQSLNQEKYYIPLDSIQSPCKEEIEKVISYEFVNTTFSFSPE